MEKMGTNDRGTNRSLNMFGIRTGIKESGMKMKRIGMALIFSVIFFFADMPFAGELNFAPAKNGNRAWRIGYYEPCYRVEYRNDLVGIIKELMIHGWMRKRNVPSGEQKTDEIWNWLSNHIESDYIRFVGDAFYSGNQGDRGMRAATDMATRLNAKNDVDLLIAVGALSRQNIEATGCRTHTIVIPTDFRTSGGLGSSDRIYVCNPFPQEQQIRNFHDIIGFKKLGTAYENTIPGKNTSAIKELEKVALERGFTIIACYTGEKNSDPGFAEERVGECFEKLVEKNVDAIYIADQSGVTKKNIGILSEIANKKKIPTFYQNGSKGVDLGFLMSITGRETENLGHLYAKTIAAKLNGATHGQLDRIYETPPKIAINIKTAEKIGFDPTAQLLIKADEVYGK